MNKIVVQDQRNRQTVRAKRIKKILSFCLKNQTLNDHEVHVSLVSDQKIRKLNKQFRNKDKPTDVLSFEQNFQHGAFLFLGDIIISLETAKKQAQEKGLRLTDELSLLSIHGLLHLLGYDHQTDKQEKIMFGIQDALFEKTKHM